MVPDRYTKRLLSIIAGCLAMPGVSALAQQTSESASTPKVNVESCERLTDMAAREACWVQNRNFNCIMLADADEQLRCSLAHLVPLPSSESQSTETEQPSFPGIPDGITAHVPKDRDLHFDNNLQQFDMLPLPGYSPGAVDG